LSYETEFLTGFQNAGFTGFCWFFGSVSEFIYFLVCLELAWVLRWRKYLFFVFCEVGTGFEVEKIFIFVDL